MFVNIKTHVTSGQTLHRRALNDLSCFRSARCNWICADLLPLTVQITARVPGCGGGRRSDALVVILHLKPDWPTQAPEDIQQALHYQLPLFLVAERTRAVINAHKHTHTHMGASPQAHTHTCSRVNTDFSVSEL